MLTKNISHKLGLVLIAAAALFGIASFALGATHVGITEIIDTPEAHAQVTGIGGEGDIVPCQGIGCNWCDLIKLLQNVFNVAAGILGILIMIYIFYGAILYIIGGSVGSDEQTKKAKSTITRCHCRIRHYTSCFCDYQRHCGWCYHRQPQPVLQY